MLEGHEPVGRHKALDGGRYDARGFHDEAVGLKKVLGGGGDGSLPSASACGDEDLTTGVILIWSAASARACVRC